MGSFLYNLIIFPLELLVEFIFVFFMKGFDHRVLAIAGISLVTSVATLPLYSIAEKLQRAERETRRKLAPGIQKIKAVFKGDERYMILSTYYRQNHYHPIYALRNSLSLLIQIPFFIAAFNFLSKLEQLNGQGFLFINDLGAPDGMLQFLGISIHVLPIIMTIINILSGILYTKDFALRDKLQTYGISIVFLLLLYNSPSGLVLYWTLNNIFSLFKNIFHRFKSPLKITYLIASILMVAATIIIIVINPTISTIKIFAISGITVLFCLLPLWLRMGSYLYRKYLHDFENDDKSKLLLLILSCVVLWLLNGMVIPSNLIVSSTVEFAYTGEVDNPLMFLIYAANIFLGIWCFWPIAIYTMFGKPTKTIIALFMLMVAALSLGNTFIFTGDYGVVNALLQFENINLLKQHSMTMLFAPLLFGVALLFVFLNLVRYRKGKLLISGLSVVIIALAFTGTYNGWNIQQEFKTIRATHTEQDKITDGLHVVEPFYHLSGDGQNVIIIMLDRAISSYFPYILEQFPELKNQYRGFTYYPNTVSFGRSTMLGVPALMGGYEYTPDNINKRVSEKLVDKHNESMLVLPRIFAEGGYDVTVTDPPFSNYTWSGDLTPFEPYPEIRVANISALYALPYKRDHSDVLDKNNSISSVIFEYLPVFTLLKTSPPILRELVYDDGNYFLSKNISNNLDEFLASYGQLFYLRELTDYTGVGNTYTFIDNETVHEPVILQSPEYEPRSTVTEIFIPFDGNKILSKRDIGTYHVNVAAVKRIGLWLEKLQHDGMYNNTRIIIVADHGRDVFVPSFKHFSKDQNVYGDYNPLFLAKDFNSQSPLIIDNTFMTNADAALLAVEDLGISTINPFTGKDLYENVNKEVVNVYRGPWAAKPSMGPIFDFDYSRSYTVRDNIFVESNWKNLETAPSGVK